MPARPRRRQAPQSLGSAMPAVASLVEIELEEVTNACYGLSSYFELSTRICSHYSIPGKFIGWSTVIS